MFKIFFRAFAIVLVIYTIIFSSVYFFLSHSPRKITKDGIVFKYAVDILGGIDIDYDEITVFIPKKSLSIDFAAKNLKITSKRESFLINSFSSSIDLKRLFIGKIYMDSAVADNISISYYKDEDLYDLDSLQTENFFDYRKKISVILDVFFLRKSQVEINNIFIKNMRLSQLEGGNNKTNFLIKSIKAEKIRKNGLINFAADAELFYQNENMSFKLINFKDKNGLTSVQMDFINFDMKLISKITGITFGDKNRKNIDANFFTLVDNQGVIREANFNISRIGDKNKKITFSSKTSDVLEKNKPNKIKIEVESKNIDIKDLIEFWPGSYALSYKKLLELYLKDFFSQKVNVVLITEPKNLKNPDFLQKEIIKNLEIKLLFKDAVLKLDKHLTLKNASGIIYLKEEKILISVENGLLENSKLVNSLATIFENSDDKKFYIKLDLNIVGPIKDLFLFIQDDKNSFSKTIAKYKNLTSGQAKSIISSYFRLEDENLNYSNSKINIQLDDLNINKAFGNNAISGDNIYLASEGLGLNIKGVVKLDNIKADTEFKRTYNGEANAPIKDTQFYNEIKILSKTNNQEIYDFLEKSSLDFAEFNGIKELFQNSILGEIVLQIKVFDKANSRKIIGDIDFTNAEIYYPLINMQKSNKAPLSVSFSIDKKTSIVNKTRVYKYSLSDFKILSEKTLAKIYGNLEIVNPFSKNKKTKGWFKISDLNIGKNDFNLVYEEDGNNSFINLKGNSLDLSKLPDVIRRFKLHKAKNHSLAIDYNINLKNLFLANEIRFYNLGGFVSCTKEECKKANFKTTNDNKKSLEIEYKNNKFFLYSDAATELIKGLGISNNIIAKKISVVAVKKIDAKDEEPYMSGELEISSVRLIKSPILGKILSFTSFKGLNNTLKGEGLQFDKIVADFSYKNNIISVKRLKFLGGPFGLTTYGTIDINKNELDLTGAITPAIGINNFIGKIPLIGEVITGGEGEGLIATQYHIKGGVDDPKITINPLSNLTPGFLRRIWQ
jgi:hypothetical protein